LQNKKSQAQFSTIEDMQRIIENFPEFKKGERNTSKHFNILEELRKLVDTRNLYDISELEQDLVSGPDSKNKHFKAVLALLEKEDINKLEALRLVLLFALRYENDDTVRQLKNLLKSKHEI
jgi:vacuolar protein sorting-associated protein 45